MLFIVFQSDHKESDVIDKQSWSPVKSNSKVKNIKQMKKDYFSIKCSNRFEALNQYSIYEANNASDKNDQVNVSFSYFKSLHFPLERQGLDRVHKQLVQGLQ